MTRKIQAVLKIRYKNRCATCGSEEGKPNLRYPSATTKLQLGHRNPHKPLTEDNSIPQCQFCNRADRDWWVYDERGRVRKPSKQEKGMHNYHQTVKPVALCEYLILLSTQEGATVLDPFIGSGTTAVAAKRLRRHYIGIDINPQYLDIARARIAREGDEPPEVQTTASQPKLAL